MIIWRARNIGFITSPVIVYWTCNHVVPARHVEAENLDWRLHPHLRSKAHKVIREILCSSDIISLSVLNFQYTMQYIHIHSISIVFKTWLGLNVDRCNYVIVGCIKVGRALCLLSNWLRPVNVWHFHTYYEITWVITWVISWQDVCIYTHPVNLKLFVFIFIYIHNTPVTLKFKILSDLKMIFSVTCIHVLVTVI